MDFGHVSTFVQSYFFNGNLPCANYVLVAYKYHFISHARVLLNSYYYTRVITPGSHFNTPPEHRIDEKSMNRTQGDIVPVKSSSV